MKGSMTKLENMFVAAAFAEVGEFETVRFLCLSGRKERISENDTDLYEEIVAVACDLYERNGRIEGHDLDYWLEAERIVKTLRKIAGDDGKRYFFVNVPKERYSQKRKNEMKLLSFVRDEPVARL